MFGNFQDRQPESSKDEWYKQSLDVLHSEIDDIQARVMDIKISLTDDFQYPTEALRGMSRIFEGISSQFIHYTRFKRSKYYEILRRSPERLKSAKNLINSAKRTAKLFDRYARKPFSYNAIECRLQIEQVLADLNNLRVS